MNRRHALKSLSALGAGGLLLSSPMNVIAQSSSKATSFVNFKKLFQDALGANEQLIGFSNAENNYAPTYLTLEGKLPSELDGVFYRNGPAKHERGELRYKHLFEGDGMLQSFHFSNGKILHTGKFINTPKFEKEEEAKQFLYSGPDTKLDNSLPVSSADLINVANTNIIPVGSDLWALWEAGSPSLIDGDSMEFKEQVIIGSKSSYGERLKGLPFSAHPKISPNGDIWNFGLSPSGHIALYHLSSTGSVKNIGMVDAQYYGGMLHDFLITEKHLLLILPSLKRSHLSKEEKAGFFNRTEFDSNNPMKVLVVSKADLSIQKTYELPPGFAFHFGNAWEEKGGAIHFDASLYSNVDILHNLSNVMQGNVEHSDVNAHTRFFTLLPNGNVQSHQLKLNSEFPRVCDHLVGLKNKYLFHLSSSHQSLWSDTVCAVNLDTGNIDKFDYGTEFLVEEHVSVNPVKVEGKGYLVGTALHVPTKRTCLNIFKESNLADGPIVRAWLPYHLPLGFHGNFKLTV